MTNTKLDVRLIEEVTEQIEASSTLLKSLRESRAINVNPVRPSEWKLIRNLMLLYEADELTMQVRLI